MRIRKKKHLSERVNAVCDNLIIADYDIWNVKEAIKDTKFIDFPKIFKNDNPVRLEVGCGKGGFICDLAERNDDVNFFAVELLQNIVISGAEEAKRRGLKNVVFFNSGAEYLPRYIKPNSIESIYLNFSPPYPQNRCENRRLTCPRNLANYKTFLIDGGCVYQRTDDKDFFDYSIEKFNENGFTTEIISCENNFGVQTEYEKKFLKLGLPIYYLKAKK